MSTDNKRVRELIVEQATDWFVANRAELTEPERAEFADWLKASPVHVEEYLGIASLWRDLREACDYPENSIEQIIERAQSGEGTRPARLHVESVDDRTLSPWWPRSAVVFAAMLTACVGLYFMSPRWLQGMHGAAEVTVLHFETRHGEQQSVVLADNSLLHLNSDSSVTVRYGPAGRSLTLANGEVHVQVAHDTARPFHAFAGAADIVDVGTQFDIRLTHEEALVTVVEGRIAVSLHSDRAGSGHPLELVANQQLKVTSAGGLDGPKQVDAHLTTAWLHRQIVFEHEPLERVAEEFNRYSAKPIEIVSRPLQTLEISGVFATDDTEPFIAFLRSLDGVRVEVTATRIRVLKR
jgi:transmembrane sensor